MARRSWRPWRPMAISPDGSSEVAKMIILRAHHLLCAQGFRGLGYSKAFAENFAAVLEGLRRRPQTLVQVVDRPDVLCGPCPHLSEERCQRGGLGAESKVQETDRRILERLGLTAGDRLSWEALLHRIGSRLEPADLPAICGPCPWINLGHCTRGLSRLREGTWHSLT